MEVGLLVVAQEDAIQLNNFSATADQMTNEQLIPHDKLILLQNPLMASSGGPPLDLTSSFSVFFAIFVYFRLHFVFFVFFRLFLCIENRQNKTR